MRKWRSIGHADRPRIRPEIISTRLLIVRDYIADRSPTVDAHIHWQSIALAEHGFSVYYGPIYWMRMTSIKICRRTLYKMVSVILKNNLEISKANFVTSRKTFLLENFIRNFNTGKNFGCVNWKSGRFK